MFSRVWHWLFGSTAKKSDHVRLNDLFARDEPVKQGAEESASEPEFISADGNSDDNPDDDDEFIIG